MKWYTSRAYSNFLTKKKNLGDSFTKKRRGKKQTAAIPKSIQQTIHQSFPNWWMRGKIAKDKVSKRLRAEEVSALDSGDTDSIRSR